jgi:hypothetical protein
VSTEGIEAVFLETHNWGKAAKFFQELGFELEFSTDHNSGQLRNGDGPYVFIAEVPEEREPRVQLVLKVTDADAFRPDPVVEVVTPFQDTHYGTKEMTVRDPDGRLWSLQAGVNFHRGVSEVSCRPPETSTTRIQSARGQPGGHGVRATEKH